MSLIFKKKKTQLHPTWQNVPDFFLEKNIGQLFGACFKCHSADLPVWLVNQPLPRNSRPYDQAFFSPLVSQKIRLAPQKNTGYVMWRAGSGQPPPPMIRAYFDHWFPLQGLLKPSFLGQIRDQGGWLTNALNSRLAGGPSWVLHLTGIKELSRSGMFFSP